MVVLFLISYKMITFPFSFWKSSGVSLINSFATFPAVVSRSDGPWSVGFAFTLSSTITVYEVGRLYAAGNSQNHSIKIWISTDHVTPLASATILAASPSDGNNFKYAVLGTPLVLTPGNTYAIAVDEFSGGDTWKDNLDGTFSMQSVFSSISNAYENVNGVYPVNIAGTSMYSTPSMRYL